MLLSKSFSEIAVVKNRITAAVVSSCRNRWGDYYPVIEAPRPKRNDLYNEVVRRINLMKMCDCTKLLQVDLDLEESTAMNSHLSPSEVEMTSLDAVVHRELVQMPILKCRSSDLLPGLHTALRKKCLLQIDDYAETITLSNDYPSRRAILVEDADYVGAVAAVNLASYLNAHLVVIPGRSREEADSITQLFRRYDDASDPIEKNRLEDEILGCHSGDDLLTRLNGYEECVVFSSGLLYGVVLSNISCGHFLLYPDCGLHVLRNLVSTTTGNAALLIDPNQVEQAETNHIAERLKSQGSFVHTLAGPAANPVEVAFHVRELPYDIIVFVTHCGYPRGNRLKIAFQEDDASNHVLEVAQVNTITPVPGTDKFSVITFYEFETIDGVAWSDKLKHVPKRTQYVIENLNEAIAEGIAKILDSQTDVDVKFCNCMRLHDSNLIAPFEKLGNEWGPLVLNNSCGSMHHLNALFSYGGAKLYVGTMFSVLDSVAREFASGLLETDLTIGQYVREFNLRHFGHKSISCYAIMGLPNLRISYTGTGSKLVFTHQVERIHLGLIEYRNANPFHKLGERIDWTISRLQSELESLNK